MSNTTDGAALAAQCKHTDTLKHQETAAAGQFPIMNPVTKTEVQDIAAQLDARAVELDRIAKTPTWETKPPEREGAGRGAVVMRHCATALRLHSASLD